MFIESRDCVCLLAAAQRLPSQFRAVSVEPVEGSSARSPVYGGGTLSFSRLRWSAIDRDRARAAADYGPCVAVELNPVHVDAHADFAETATGAPAGEAETDTAEAPLRPGWTQFLTDEGGFPMRERRPCRALPPALTIRIRNPCDCTGVPYYYNEATGISTWCAHARPHGRALAL
jgi:hypothetical protein